MNRIITRALQWAGLATILTVCAVLGPVPQVAQAQVNFCSNALYSATTAAAVTKSDTTVFTPPARALYVGGAGDVTVRMAANTAVNVTFTAVPAGSLLPICIDQVLSTGTDATSMTILR